jgi:hypothetical protein
MSHEDPLAGLDPDEVADAERRMGADDEAAPVASYRTATMALLTFVVVFLPVVVGTFWLAEQTVYTPLCGREGGAEVIDVEIDLPIDSGLTTVTSDGRTTCAYATGERIAMQEVIPKSVAIALDWGLSIVAFGLPFALTAVVVRIRNR